MIPNLREDINAYEKLWLRAYISLGFKEKKVPGIKANAAIYKHVLSQTRKNLRLSPARRKQRIANIKLYVKYWGAALKGSKIKITDPKINQKVIALVVPALKRDDLLSPRAKIFLVETGGKKFIC